jgi:hypothetical protein
LILCRCSRRHRKKSGEANLRCITFSGTGYDGAVGQTAEFNPNIDWPRIDALSNYTRTINWEPARARRRSIASPASIRASWKYGLGWRGGTPIQKQTRQTHIVNGRDAWHIDGEGGEPVAAAPEDAERYQLDLWLNPAGIPQGGAPARRQPEGDLALGTDRDGPRRQRRRAREDARRVDHDAGQSTASRRRSTRRTRFNASRRRSASRRSATFNIEHESTEQMTFGNVKWPIVWHSHQGWDDNYQFDNASTGHNALRRKFPKVLPNVLRRSGARPRRDPQCETGAGHGDGREDGRGVYPAGRRHAQQLHGGVPRLRRGVRGAA